MLPLNKLFKSTRSKDEIVSSSTAIVKGIAPDGGLYVPTNIPSMADYIDKLPAMGYKDTAYAVLSNFFSDFEKDDLYGCIYSAYDSKFDIDEIAPVVSMGKFSFLELYHGPTLAFKDMALSILPHLMALSFKKLQMKGEIVILAATSGDTGKAALQGFANVPGTKIMVFYPHNGVSDIQKAQMVTQSGENVFVAGVKGNFDDTQNAVKSMLTDPELQSALKKRGYVFSSANSINIGRLIPQIVYYFYGYGSLIKKGVIKSGEKINIAVPTGNFGNILSAYYARTMGLPVNMLICASNENNVLSDFFNSGIYDRKRPLLKTSSPSMDILVSSNLERLVYEICDRDEAVTSDLMNRLNRDGEYEITEDMRDKLSMFYGNFSDESETYDAIREVYDSFDYVIDTHTAVAYGVYKKYSEKTGDRVHTMIASTASPFKFPRSVCSALGINAGSYSDFEFLKVLSDHTGIKIPAAVDGIDKKKVLHDTVLSKDSIKLLVEKFLRL